MQVEVCSVDILEFHLCQGSGIRLSRLLAVTVSLVLLFTFDSNAGQSGHPDVTLHFRIRQLAYHYQRNVMFLRIGIGAIITSA